MLVSINGVDITPYINEKTYKMNADKTYETWLDGNFREHRIYTRNKITGSFDVSLYGKNGIDTDAFLDIWSGGVENEVATLLVYVQNTNKNEAIEAYYEFEGKFHRKILSSGNTDRFLDKLTIKITER